LCKSEESINEIRMMLFDIVQYFRGRSRFKTTQQEIGYKMIFQGFIIKDWLGSGNAERF